MNKKGVTLVMLVISIIGIAIIAGVITINTTDISQKTILTKFAEEIKDIEDMVSEYYAINGRLPVKEKIQYTAKQLSELNTEGYAEELLLEIQKNKDTNKLFYVIDTSLININLSDRGLNETVDDIYVVTNDELKVYYVKGVMVQYKIYFSNTNITGVTMVE